METTSKFFGKSLTLWGLLTASLCSFINHRTGVNLSDQVVPTQNAVAAVLGGLQALAPAIGQLAGVLMVIVGRFRAAGPLHVFSPTPTGSPTSPTRNVSTLIALGVALSALGLSGCNTTSASGSSTVSTAGAASTTTTAIESALPLIRTGASVATGAVLDFAVQQSSTRTRLANEMYAAANAVYSLSGGTLPTPTQFQASILAFGGSQADASYAQFSTAIAGLYSAYFPKLVSGDTKTGTDLLNAIAGGIEDATASYVTVPAPTAQAEPSQGPATATTEFTASF